MNRRTAPFYCALGALLLSVATVNVCAQARKNEDAETRRTREHAYRAIEVRSAPDGIGISSGLVVVYGHPIERPYHLVFHDQRLFVNGVQVEPTLIMQREYDKSHKERITTEATQKYTQLNEMAGKARKQYFENPGKEADDKVRARILETVRSHPLVKDAHWMNEKMLIYTRKDDLYPDGNAISFSAPSPRTKAKPRKSTEEMHQDRIKELEKHLEAGGCIFFGTVGAWQGPAWRCKDIKKSVNEIMGQAALSSDEKEKKLRDAFGGSDADPLDVMANYNASEWK